MHIALEAPDKEERLVLNSSIPWGTMTSIFGSKLKVKDFTLFVAN